MIASFALRFKKRSGGVVRFSHWLSFRNCVVASSRMLQLLLLLSLLLLLPPAVFIVFHSCPHHSFSARSGSLILHCSSCVLVSHVGSGVLRFLPV